MEKSFAERVTEAKEAVNGVSPTEANNLRQGCEEVIFLDPRPADAIAQTTGIIPGALNITLAEIKNGQLPNALGDKWTRVVTSCQAGPMGAIAAHELSKQGFSRVSYLEGGTQGWLDAGLPTNR